MKKILVTGADGFIGSHLVEHFVRANVPVRALCCYNSFGHSGWLSNIDPEIKSHIEFIYGDIRDAESMGQAVKGCSHVFHLASLIAIPYSYTAPRSYVETNVIGTLNILLAAREQGAVMIHTSTSEVYGTAEYVPIDEKHPLKGQSPYAATKIGADQLALSFFQSYDLPVIVIRPFNTFGPRQSMRAIIPTITMQLLRTDELSIGNLESTRDFTYVEDTVRGIASALNVPEAYGKTINLGTGYEISIKQLAHEIAALLGKDLEFKLDPMRLRPDNSEVMRLCSNNQLAKTLLNWSPLYANLKGLRKGLEQSIQWFSTHDGLKIDYRCQDMVY